MYINAKADTLYQRLAYFNDVERQVTQPTSPLESCMPSTFQILTLAFSLRIQDIHL